MSRQTVVHGNTKQEVQEQADKLLKEADPYEQPFAYSPHQQPDGTWTCTVLFRGLD